MDIRIANHGSIVILHAISEAAREWLDANLDVDVQTWGRLRRRAAVRRADHRRRDC